MKREIKLLKKEIQDLEAQKTMLKLLINEHKTKAEALRSMVWKPNLTPGTNELHFNKWRNFSIAANKKALEELERQARFTIQHLKHKQRILTNLCSKNNNNEIQ